MLEPDIVVLAPDVPDTVLVAEVKTDANTVDWNAVESQIKEYMVGRQCPIALIVTPTESRVYRDSFSEMSVDAVLMDGTYPTVELLGLSSVPDDAKALETAVGAHSIPPRWHRLIPPASIGEISHFTHRWNKSVG